MAARSQTAERDRSGLRAGEWLSEPGSPGLDRPALRRRRSLTEGRMQRELILGGQRSGKSRCAERRAAAWLAEPPHEAVLLATALPHDDEMRGRIAVHRADRAAKLPRLLTEE